MCKTAVFHEADFIPLPPKLLDLWKLGGGCCCHLLGSHLPLLPPTIDSHLPPMAVLRGGHSICGALCPLSTSSTHCKLKCSKKGEYFCVLAHMSSVKILMLAGSVALTFNPSTQQERQEASRSLRQKSVLSAWGAPGPPKLHSETLS